MADHRAKGFLLEIALISIAPILVTSIFLIATASQRQLTAPACDPLRIAKLALFGDDKTGLTCASLPFAADIPSWVLGATSSVAVALYYAFSRRLGRLIDELFSNGLLTTGQLDLEPMKTYHEKMKRRLRVPLWVQIAMFVPVLAIGCGFYARVSQRNHLFKDMSTLQGAAGQVAGVSEAQYRQSWWVAWETHPALAVGWILVGSLGAYFACRQAYLWAQLTRIFRKAPDAVVFNYVPARLDRDHGWRPVGRIIALSYVSTLSFIFSVIALLYILRDPEAGILANGLLALFAIGGTIVNVRFVLSLLGFVRKSHQKVVRLQLLSLNNEIERIDRERKVTPLAGHLLSLRAEQLASVRSYPVQGKTVRAVSLAPGLIAVSKLTYDAMNLLVK